MNAARWLRRLLLPALAASALTPLLVLAVRSLARRWFYPALWPAELGPEAWSGLFAAGDRLAVAGLTSIALGIGTGLVACTVAFPIGRAMASLHGWRRHFAAASAFLPVAVPPIALGIGLQFSFLTLGLGGSFAGVLLAHAVPAVGYASLYFLGIFVLFDRRIEDEARSLGATPRQVLFRVTLPLVRRPIAEAFLLGFLVSWAQVPLTLLIGAGAVRTLPIEVLAFVQAGQDRVAATGALVLVIPALALVAALGLAARRTEVVPV